MGTYTKLLLFLLAGLAVSCRTTLNENTRAEPPLSRPAPSVLTVILEADPTLDTLTVVKVLRATGSIRSDYPFGVPTPPTDYLLFSFLGSENRVLRQTTLPYPGPNRYEVPHEDGHIEEITVPEAERVLLLRTNYQPALKTLRITGRTPDDRPIEQFVDLTLVR